MANDKYWRKVKIKVAIQSEKLAEKMDELQHTHSHWCIIIGGPEGLHPKLLQVANEKWSLQFRGKVQPPAWAKCHPPG
jgi:23S rRNA pseudoU1915 N3-methylase RlmH